MNDDNQWGHGIPEGDPSNPDVAKAKDIISKLEQVPVSPKQPSDYAPVTIPQHPGEIWPIGTLLENEKRELALIIKFGRVGFAGWNVTYLLCRPNDSEFHQMDFSSMIQELRDWKVVSDSSLVRLAKVAVEALISSNIFTVEGDLPSPPMERPKITMDRSKHGFSRKER